MAEVALVKVELADHSNLISGVAELLVVSREFGIEHVIV